MPWARVVYQPDYLRCRGIAPAGSDRHCFSGPQTTGHNAVQNMASDAVNPFSMSSRSRLGHGWRKPENLKSRKTGSLIQPRRFPGFQILRFPLRPLARHNRAKSGRRVVHRGLTVAPAWAQAGLFRWPHDHPHRAQKRQSMARRMPLTSGCSIMYSRSQ